MKSKICLSAVVAFLFAVFSHAAFSEDWAQLQNGPMRKGFTSEQLQPPFTSAWKTNFQPERIYPSTQPICCGGRIYIGTESGNMYSLDADTGEKLWKYSTDGPILHTAAASDGRVYFGSMDGCVYAIDAERGHQLWKFDSELDTGFSTAVALGDEKLFAVNRGGVVYALNPDNGELLWQCDIDVPLLQSPAYAPAQQNGTGLVIFGGMDMRVYAIDAEAGEIKWKSDRLYGQAFKDYWPVIHQGKVIVRSFIAYPKPHVTSRTRSYRPDNFPLTWADAYPPRSWYPEEENWKLANRHGKWLRAHSDEVAAGEIPQDIRKAEQRVLDYYKEHPEDMDLFALDIRTGRQTILPHWCAQTMNGATSTPCVDKDGLMVMPIMYINSRWGRMDLSKGRFVDILYDGYTVGGERITELKKPGYVVVAGGGNTDENIAASAAGNLIFGFHCQESNANYTGVWNSDTRRWHQIAGMGWGELTNNSQGGGTSPPFVANGMLYHMSFHSVRAWKPAK